MGQKDFLSELKGGPTEEIRVVLRTLMKHIPVEKFGIVGGLAIRYWYSMNGVASPERDWNDIDFAVHDIKDIPTSLAQDFLIYHYHPPKSDGGYFHMAFVHAPTKMKCHIFPYHPSHKESFASVPFEDSQIFIVSLEEQLVKTVFDIASVSDSWPIDPKQFEDAALLVSIADMAKAQEIWQKNNFSQHPSTIQEAMAKAEGKRVERPDLVRPKPYRKPSDFVCPECTHDAGFPIISIREAYLALGYEI